MLEVVTRKQARGMGMKRYFTGDPCKHGHFSERLVGNGTCLECTRLRGINQRARSNPSELRQQKREYWTANRERELKRARDWKERNRQRYNQRRRDQYAINPEKDKVRTRDWRAQNPDKYASLARHSRHLRRAVGRANGNTADRAAVDKLLAASIVCPDCRKKYSRARRKSVDHVIPISKGGLHVIENLRVVCSSCNSSKSAGNFTSCGQGMLL